MWRLIFPSDGSSFITCPPLWQPSARRHTCCTPCLLEFCCGVSVGRKGNLDCSQRASLRLTAFYLEPPASGGDIKVDIEDAWKELLATQDRWTLGRYAAFSQDIFKSENHFSLIIMLPKALKITKTAELCFCCGLLSFIS